VDAGLRTPLLDSFRHGDVPREVRLLAAGGALAPRPLEQLGLLMLLSKDSDAEVSATAERTLATLPAARVAAVLARSDAPLDVRQFFLARGIAPAPGASIDADQPLLEADTGDEDTDAAGSADDKAAVAKRINEMSVPEKVKAAMKGTREMRAVLIRDPNRMVAAAVLSSPRLTTQEVEAFARMANVTEEILRTIGSARGWMKNYGIMLGLTKNPKTPLAMTLTLLHRLNDRDLRGLSIDRNVPEPLRIAARQKVVLSQK
jgi:hypothetical protein